MPGEKPLLADGSIVGDYSPLIIYWRKARERNRRLAEAATLMGEDFDYLDEIIRRASGRISVAEARERLRRHFASRIDPGIAAEAVREAYGASVEAGRAREMLADIMAGWLIEAAKSLKRYKVGITNPSSQPRSSRWVPESG